MATLERTMSQVMDQKPGYQDTKECPPATQDITLNLKNRGKAINSADYGPENPDLPNTPYWDKMAKEWGVTPEEAKTSRCGNCSAFNQEQNTLDCIANGIGEEGDPWAVIDAGDLGYCEIFDFKCASSRTCRAWVAEGSDGQDNQDDGESQDDGMSLLTIRIGKA